MTNLSLIKTSSLAIVGVIALSGTLSALADDGSPSQNTLVSDQSELAAAGYPGSSAVYTDGNGHYFQLVGENDIQLDPRTFGPTSTGYTVISPSAFIDNDPPDSSARYDLGGNNLFCNGPGGQDEFLAPVHLPNGALITGFDYFGFDNSAAQPNEAQLQRVCQDTDTSTPVVTDLTATLGSTVAGVPGNFIASESLSETVNNRQCQYNVFVSLSNGACVGNLIQVYKARVRWMRQISPAPAVATFTDVPTGHPFFKEVEAMVASGITGGLGGGLYGPDQNLTRGQMAAFLSRALGL